MHNAPQHLAEPPNLARARAFTRVLGPIAIVGGATSLVMGVVMWAVQAGVLATMVMAYGAVTTIFGLGTWARTESALGRTVRWIIVLIFLAGGGLALLQWAQLLWGSRVSTASLSTDLTILGFYLMAGPALIVPGVLAAVRPAWVPLIVAPAIVAVASTAVVGLMVLTSMGTSMLSLGDTSNPLMLTISMVITAIASAGVLLWPLTSWKRIVQ